MAGAHDSTHIRIPRTLKADLERVGRNLRQWAGEFPQIAPDYLDNADHIPIDAVILHLLRCWEKHRVRSAKSRRGRAQRRRQSTSVVPTAEGARPASGDTPVA